MKNGQIYFVLLLSGALMSSCAKEEALPLNQLNPAEKIEASLNFEISGRSYNLNAVQYDAASSNHANEPTCGGTPSSSSSFGPHGNIDWTNDWTNYSRAAKSVFITRQDLSTSPNLRLILHLKTDLDLPAAPVEATLSLTDFSGQLVPDNDDPAGRKNALYSASGEQVQVNITRVKDNQIEGTFSGTLETFAGASIDVKKGFFKAMLKKY